ncbi:uncharacterized protein LOC128995353 [Macrosteles quadrilineatus]|uniref:uncharacterized protein LOC128995353 n=1 Tax=Macrosteles quadrilineatus TaxID=74068 RepID=UPI0023E211E2|nr:uncharacterized protein LOC128995353 [Macrosteles quadrilineatus]
MSTQKTPTIEQKSVFSAKTKEGSDVQFEAVFQFYVNPSGDVRITGPAGNVSEESSFVGTQPIADEITREEPGRKTSGARPQIIEERKETEVGGPEMKEERNKSKVGGPKITDESKETEVEGPKITDESKETDVEGAKIKEAKKETEDWGSTITEEHKKEDQGVEIRKPTGKLYHNEEIDKQIPRIQGDCPIRQFVPDPCRAVDDVINSISSFFSSPA